MSARIVFGRRVGWQLRGLTRSEVDDVEAIVVVWVNVVWRVCWWRDDCREGSEIVVFVMDRGRAHVTLRCR